MPKRPPAATSILIAEDDDNTRIFVQTVLKNLNFKVIGCVCDGLEAVAQACTLKPDVILLDIGMPKLDGLEAARRILGKMLVPIVILTGRADNATLEQARAIGVHAFLIKPLTSPHQLRAAIAIAITTCDRQRQNAMSIGRLNTLLRSSRLKHPTLKSFGLTKRQIDVVRWMAEGWTNREIAGELSLSPRTVEKHIQHVIARLGVKSRNAVTRLVVDAVDLRRRRPRL